MGKMTAQNVAGTQLRRVNAQYKNVNMTGFADNKAMPTKTGLYLQLLTSLSATSFTITLATPSTRAMYLK